MPSKTSSSLNRNFVTSSGYCLLGLPKIRQFSLQYTVIAYYLRCPPKRHTVIIISEPSAWVYMSVKGDRVGPSEWHFFDYRLDRFRPKTIRFYKDNNSIRFLQRLRLKWNFVNYTFSQRYVFFFFVHRQNKRIIVFHRK